MKRWPRWALVLFIGVLRRIGILPGLLFRAEIEMWRREAYRSDDLDAWWCPAAKGIA